MHYPSIVATQTEMGLYLTNRFICAARNVSLMVDFFRTSYEKSLSLA